MVMRKMFVLAFFSLSGIFFFFNQSVDSATQDVSATLTNNSCVECHAGLSHPAQMSVRYLDWHLSAHKLAGVSCDKCHGGNPTVKDKNKAHSGVLSSATESSRLNTKNLPETCGACHQKVVAAFVESKHYQALKGTKLGPSCNTCHTHMGSQLIFSPDETVQLCATCHDSEKPLLARRPDIPKRAGEVMTSLQRANGIVLWANGLLTDGKNKKVDVSSDEAKMVGVREMLADAKASWHSFTLDAVQQKADKTFDSGTKIKDALLKRLYPQ